MQILICGYGAMGHEIQKVLEQRGHGISATVDPYQDADAKHISPSMLEDCDVVIEFSHADAVAANAELYAKHAASAVVGTTGWDPVILKKIAESNASYLYGSNFSVGAHIFFALAQRAAELVAGISEYDVAVSEIHHRMKKDSPSGTALTAAEYITQALARKQDILTDRVDGRISEDSLHVSSMRLGSVPGTHTVYMDSAADSIEITHRARNRGGFALGAVLAAEWVQDKKGVFTVEDFIQDIMRG